jgi:hypothetical protein
MLYGCSASRVRRGILELYSYYWRYLLYLHTVNSGLAVVDVLRGILELYFKYWRYLLCLLYLLYLHTVSSGLAGALGVVDVLASRTEDLDRQLVRHVALPCIRP